MEKSHAFNLCKPWLFGDCFHPQFSFKLNTSSLINLSPRAAFLSWFSLASLNQHQPPPIFPAVWQCPRATFSSSCTLIFPKTPSPAGLGIAPLSRCVVIQSESLCLPSKPFFYCHTASQGGSEGPVCPAEGLEPPPSWCHPHIS